MPYFLLIDTSSNCCSVAIADGSQVIHQQIKCEGNEHAALLPQFVTNCLHNAKLQLNNIQAISISIGPGSYTGLRVGLSFVKAMCYANQIPLITVSTLEMISYGIQQFTNNTKGYYIPMIDARRMEVYTAVLNNEFDFIEAPFAKIITENFITERNITDKIFVAGSGAFKIKSFTLNDNVMIIDKSFCEAQYLATKTNELYNQGVFSDIAYCEPFYLKQFGEIL